MRDLLKKGFTAGLGLAVISKERAEKTVKDLVKRGEISPQASRELLDKLIIRGEQESEQLDRQLRERMKKILNEMEIATREDLEPLQQHIRMLEQRLDNLSPQARSSENGETNVD